MGHAEHSGDYADLEKVIKELHFSLDTCAKDSFCHLCTFQKMYTHFLIFTVAPISDPHTPNF